jgi:iron(III) transport system ATP-binding protein
MGVAVRGLHKQFRAGRERVAAIDDVSLEVEEGEFMVILGPSGSGKTTLLRSLAGLERPDSGEIEIGGRVVYSSAKRVWTPPERRGVSMVFQSYALWPHMTVADNVAYPPRSRRAPAQEVRDRMRSALEMVHCYHLKDRHPSQLSGGQQQRVALARAIATGSRTILFDEPLSNVDAKVREQLRLELLTMQRELGLTAVYVTHDQTEATVLGDRVAIMRNGKIAQLAPPREAYDRPVSRFVAEFLGAANSFSGRLGANEGEFAVAETPLGRVLGSAAFADGERPAEVAVVFRPERCHLTASSEGSTNSWEAIVERRLFLGHCMEYIARIGDVRVSVKSMDRDVLDEGCRVWLRIEPHDVRFLNETA